MTYKISYSIPRRHNYSLQRVYALAFQQACRSFEDIYKKSVGNIRSNEDIANWNAEYALWVDFWHVNHIDASPSISEDL